MMLTVTIEQSEGIFLFDFISFTQKNTKKKHWRYANTSDKNVTIH